MFFQRLEWGEADQQKAAMANASQEDMLGNAVVITS